MTNKHTLLKLSVISVINLMTDQPITNILLIFIMYITTKFTHKPHIHNILEY